MYCDGQSNQLKINNGDALSLYFDNYTITNGFSGNNITCIYKDKRGFLWVGTTKGLNKYDGRDVKVYTHNRNNPHSISNNYIQSIVEDSSGNIWLGTKNGICKFNPFNNESENFFHHPNHPFSLNSDQDNHLYKDSKGKIWIGNTAGLSYFDKLSGHFINSKLSVNPSQNLQVVKMFEDRQGHFWVGTTTGLFCYDRGKHTTIAISFDAKSKDKQPAITSIFQDHAGRIWVGTWGNGFCLFNRKTGKLDEFKWEHNHALPGTTNIVLSVGETSGTHGNHYLWVGTAGGLLKIKIADDIATGDYKILGKVITSSLRKPPFVNNNNVTTHTIKGSLMNCIYNDNDQVLWIGSNHGLNQYLKENQLFKRLPIIKGSVMSIRKDNYQGKSQFLIASWYGNGLTILDDRLRVVKTFKEFPPKAKNLDNGQISDVLRTKDGLLWVATFHGLYCYDENTGRIDSYLHNEKNLNSLASNKIIALGEDNEGNLWISNYKSGIDRLNEKTKQFTHFEHKKGDLSSISDNLVWSIYKAPNGEMEFCTNSGLSIFDSKTGKFTNYTEKKQNKNTLYGGEVSSVLTDRDGNLWIATNEGLNEFNVKTKKFKLYDSEEGLKNESVIGMAQDDQNRIWLVSDNSIAVFNPLDESFINYDDQNGLSLAHLSGTIISDGKGGFLLGGKNALIHFNPSDFKPLTTNIPVYITHLEIGGIQKVFNHPFEDKDPIKIDYPENSFSCSFTAPEFNYGNEVRYSYRLDGVDKDWKNSGKRNFVDYASLKPGKYLFHIKASSGKGSWNRKETLLSLIVYPPFWQTWWFRLITLFIVIVILYFVFTLRINAIRKKEKVKTETNKQMAEMRLKVLRNRMNPHFMFNALNSIQECILTKKTDSAYRYLSKFSRLVRMILEHSDYSFITLSKEIEIVDLYLQLESLRFEQSFNYQIDTNNLEIDFITIPPMMIQPFVENAIWHGLLNKEGEKKLIIQFQANEDTIIVTIKDNGIGRDKARTKKINTIHNQQSLGMQIIAEQLHHFDTSQKQRVGFKVEDLFEENQVVGQPKLSAGTKVILTLPIIKEI